MSDQMPDDDYEGYSDGETCWQCMGSGGWHDCGEDCCCCLDPDYPNVTCPECNGSGVVSLTT